MRLRNESNYQAVEAHLGGKADLILECLFLLLAYFSSKEKIKYKFKKGEEREKKYRKL